MIIINFIHNLFNFVSKPLILDFENGRVLSSGLLDTSIITGAFAIKDFNIYFSNETEDDLIIENKVGGQYSSAQTSMSYADTELRIIQPVDDTLFAQPNQVYQVRFPQKDIKVKVKNFQNVSFS